MRWRPRPPANQFTPAHPFRLDTATVVSFTRSNDPTASDLLAQRGSDPFRAQQFLASLSVVALEQPSGTRRNLEADPVALGPAARRIVHPRRPPRPPAPPGEPRRRAFDTVKPATVAARPTPGRWPQFDRHGPPDQPSTRTLAETRRFRLDGRGRGPDRIRLRHDPATTVADVSPASGTGSRPADSANSSDQLAIVTGAITAPTSRSIQLTSRRARVPLSIENALDQTVRVRVTLASQKLDFPADPTACSSCRPVRTRPSSSTSTPARRERSRSWSR